MKYLALIIIAVALAGCGSTTIVEKTVTETITASPSPAPSPAYSDLELEGITTIELLLADLKHIYNTEEKALRAGGTGNVTRFVDIAEHYADDWQTLQRKYNATNNGDPYGGKVSHLEALFEDAGRHVRKYGVALLRVITNGSNSDVINGLTQQARAKSGIADVELELERLNGEGWQ
jgi:hypothetical protein